MSEPKTKKNNCSVSEFIEAVSHPTRREDSKVIASIMGEVTKKEPHMWGDSIIGYDEYHYVYASGKEGDWPMIGFSPRKQNLSLYIMPGFGIIEDLLPSLGKHKTSKACLYINKLADVNMDVLKSIIKRSYDHMCDKYPS